MCGIVGLLDPDGKTPAAALGATVGSMADELRHRGPDDAGVAVDADAGIAFAHRRLSIIDLSPEGHQPMTSASGRLTITFNGEIYNYPKLRRELEAAGVRFRGHSDTEVLLALIERVGLEAALGETVGMFAFALWDRAGRTLHLVRDRLGKKPLYFGWLGQTFGFASEPKALCRHPDFVAEVDRGALMLFLRHQYIPAPHCIWEGLHKLPAGCILSLALGRGERLRQRDLLADIKPFWSARAVAEDGVGHRWDGSGDHVGALDDLLSQAVADRMVADVPLGAFLSGGIDSSVIVALMQKHASRPVKTFAIGFTEDSFDEAACARQVASHLGTDHTEHYVTAAEARAVIPDLPEMFDEPFADPSQIPMFHVARTAREQVTVCLSGDGGDEVFGGYTRYRLAEHLRMRAAWLPDVVRHGAVGLARRVSPRGWDRILASTKLAAPRGLRGGWSGDRVHKLAALLAIDDPDARYQAMVNVAPNPNAIVTHGLEPATLFENPSEAVRLDDYTDRMMYYDTVTYLPDDILVKVDRATMAVSLEARAPLLDHRVVEFAWHLPLSAKLHNGHGKWLLRQLFNRYLPKEFGERPKTGFGIPVADWLRGPLRPWAEDLLDEQRLAREGYLRPAVVRWRWQEHQAGTRNWGYQLWTILMFQAWQARWL